MAEQVSRVIPVWHIRERQILTGGIKERLGLQRRGVLERFQPERMLNERLADKTEETFQFVGHLFAHADAQTLAGISHLVYYSILSCREYLRNKQKQSSDTDTIEKKLLDVIYKAMDQKVNAIGSENMGNDHKSDIEKIKANIGALKDGAETPYPYVLMQPRPFNERYSYKYTYPIFSMKNHRVQMEYKQRDYFDELSSNISRIHWTSQYAQDWNSIPINSEKMLAAALRGWEQGNRPEVIA